MYFQEVLKYNGSVEHHKINNIFSYLHVVEIRMARYYFPLLANYFLSIKLFLKLHMNIMLDLLSTTLPCLFKVSLLFLTWSLNFFSCYLFVNMFFPFEKLVSLEYWLSEWHFALFGFLWLFLQSNYIYKFNWILVIVYMYINFVCHVQNYICIG